MSLLLNRHAMAGHSSQWQGDDGVRPIDDLGKRQAEGLVEALAEYELDRIVSSPYVRCVQTVEPLAKARGLELELDEQLGADRLHEVPQVLERLKGQNARGLHPRRPAVARRSQVQEGLDLGARRRARAGALHPTARLGRSFGGRGELQRGSLAEPCAGDD